MNTLSNEKIFEYQKEMTIYELYSPKGIKYYLAIPNGDITNYTMYLTFPSNNVNNLATYEIRNEIVDISQILNKINTGSILLKCDIDFDRLTEAANVNDDLLYTRLLNELQDITKDAFNAISKSKNGTINQIIHAIKQTPYDTKFINWLDIKLGGYLDGIKIEDLRRKLNPFVMEDDVSSGGTALSGGDLTDTNNNSYVKKKVPPKKNNHGYFTFAMFTLIISMIVGIMMAIMLVN